MRSPVSVRRFFAGIVLACWSAVTLLTIGQSIANDYAHAVYVREEVLHAKPDSSNIGQLQAQNKALEDLVDYQKDFNQAQTWEFRIWVGLTLLGAALFAERRDASN
jgi:hypothetical protein